MKEIMLEDVVIIGGLIGVQFVYAGSSILQGYLMSFGLNPFTIIIFSTFATFLLLSPFAVLFERKQWPKKFSLKLMIQLVVISVSGVTLFQTLFLKGINLTSPAMATAMPNLAPGLIFLIAWIFRLEQVRYSCIYSRIKIMGTFLCVVGAIFLSVMHSTTSAKESGGVPSLKHDYVFDKDKVIGCLYLLAAIIVLSSNIVLQAATLGDFPAPMSLCVLTSFIGVFVTLVMQLIQYHKLEFGLSVFSGGKLIAYCVLVGSVSGTCVSFNGWAMKKKGPVFVAVFSPIAAVISVFISIFTLGETISLGSLGSMLLMFIGLYFVLWAKGKEGYAYRDGDESEFDAEKPLLS